MRQKALFLLLFFSMDFFYIFPEVMVITNPDTEVSTLKKKEIRDIFTGKKTRWSDGRKIIITILESREVRKEFLWECVRKTPSQFRNYWRRKVFTGEGTLPKSFRTKKELMDFVAATKGAVGYISGPADKRVKVIKLSNGKGGGQ
ncbi:MAG: phosphate ABC transporter substrate-binding protein [bacterium]|nr:phosphate ABC transporter substrate-binding protein [bacterium]